jgi:hypothetical protein
MKNPMLIALTVLALVVMPANAQVAKSHPEITANTTIGNVVTTHMAAGGGWNTVIVLVNLGKTFATYTLRFYGDSGTPQAFPFKNTGTGTDLGTQSVLTGTIPVGGMVSLKARDKASSTTTGWALIDPSSTGDIGGAAIFTYDQTGQQAVVPLETAATQNFILVFDNSGGNVMGVALVNPHPTAVVVNVVFRDLNGNVLLSDHITMSALEHTSFILASRYPGLVGQVGTALFSTDGSADAVAALGILANSVGAYTTVFTLAAQ